MNFFRSSVLVLSLVQLAGAQSSLAPWIKPQFFDASGKPLSGGLVNFYASGTSTPQNTYQDAALTTPNSNPVVLDSAGRPNGSTGIYFQAKAYKVVATTSTGVSQWTQDNVADLGQILKSNLADPTLGAALVAIQPYGGGAARTLADLANPAYGGSIVAYKSAGSGSTVRTLASKAQETVYLQDYLGTVACDGVADTLFAFTAAQAYLVSIGGGVLHLPSRTAACGVSNTLVVSAGVHLVGDNLKGTGVVGTTAFPDNTPVVCGGLCSDATAEHYLSIQHMYVSCPPAGRTNCTAIQSVSMQENAKIEDVGIFNYTANGILLSGSGVQNSKLTDIYGAAYTGAAGYAAVGIHLSGSNSRMAIQGVTLYSGNGFLQTGPAILLENFSQGAIRDVHCEQVAVCIKIDSGSTASIENVFGNWTNPTMIQLTATSKGADIRNAVAYFVSGPGNYTVTGAANNGAGKIRLTTSTANAFVTGEVVTAGSVGGVTAANGTWFIDVIDSTHIDLRGSVFSGSYTSGGNVLGSEVVVDDKINGNMLTGIYDQYVTNYAVGPAGSGVVTTSPNFQNYSPIVQTFQLKLGTVFNGQSDGNGTYFQTSNGGLLVQKQSMAGGYNSGGLYLIGNGYANAANYAAITSGATGDLGTWTARATSANIFSMLAGTAYVTADSGLTAGNTFTPTNQMLFSPTGPMVRTAAFAGLPAAGSAGRFLYCSDCVVASPCASGGSGHLAVSNGSAWQCN